LSGVGERGLFWGWIGEWENLVSTEEGIENIYDINLNITVGLL